MPDYSIVESLCKELNITISELIAAKEKESESTPVYTEEQVALLLYKAQQMENKNRIAISKPIKKGVTIGSVLAMIISYTTWKSVGWESFTA